MQRMQALERSILSGEFLKSVVGDASGQGGEETTEPVGTAEAAGAPNDVVQISGSPGGTVTLRMRMPGDLLLFYRDLERAHRRTLPGASFIQFLCASFWRTWVPTLGV